LFRTDIQSVFDPIFNQILTLVQGQIDAVAKQGAKMKTLFLVGGLGSNLYLYKFLQRNLTATIQVLQPDSGYHPFPLRPFISLFFPAHVMLAIKELGKFTSESSSYSIIFCFMLRPPVRDVRGADFRYSAIMRGAVLYKLGLDFVKERIARRHYGHAWNPNFIQGHHPEYRKFTNVAGWVLCSNAVDYYVKKVHPYPPIARSGHFFTSSDCPPTKTYTFLPSLPLVCSHALWDIHPYLLMSIACVSCRVFLTD
jgi:hypothetical protein